MQNILIDRHCQCRDIFLCPHDVDSGYGVLISDFDSVLQVERGREKLERTKLHGCPIKYSVHGTAGYRPPEVGEGMCDVMLCDIVLYYSESFCVARFLHYDQWGNSTSQNVGQMLLSGNSDVSTQSRVLISEKIILQKTGKVIVGVQPPDSPITSIRSLMCIAILLNKFTSIFHTQNTPLVHCAYVTTIISMSLSPSIALFPTHLHLPPLFPAVYVYIITLPVFCKIIFSLMRIQVGSKRLNYLTTTSVQHFGYIVEFPH